MGHKISLIFYYYKGVVNDIKFLWFFIIRKVWEICIENFDFLLLEKSEKHGIPIFFDILLLGMEWK